MNQSYFTWGDNRVLAEIPEFGLPFELAIYGLVAGIILQVFFGVEIAKKLGWGKIQKSGRPPKETLILEGWQTAALFLGTQIIGQIAFLVLPSPMLDSIGPLPLRWYSLLFATAFICGYYIGARLFTDAGKSVELMENALMYVIVGTVLGARLGHCLFYDPVYYLTNPLKILMVWEGGLASHGAAIGIPLSVYLFTRKHKEISFLWLADRVAIPVVFGGVFVRLGNFFNSEILGHATDVSWAVIFTSIDMIPRHPSMLYESFYYLILSGIVFYLYKKYATRPPEGFMLGFVFAGIFLGRFFIEFTKVEQAHFSAGSLNMGQWLSIPVVAMGIWLMVRSFKQQSSEQNEG